MAIHEGRPERRAMAFTRTAAGVCVANLHATNDIPDLAAEDVRRAAAAATEWADGAPLLFGGDLNLRPAESPAIFAELEERFGLAGTTAPDAIDHCSSAASSRSSPRPAGRGSGARSSARGWRCASPITRRSSAASKHPDERVA